ncbi:unnamed protein product [Durusdinium trenchii]|uniref:Uncharacterized protein n=1 Tax=Durusdinium trenchii TaxID=1381693 RepID=A0ABP0QQ96_9DINO
MPCGNTKTPCGFTRSVLNSGESSRGRREALTLDAKYEVANCLVRLGRAQEALPKIRQVYETRRTTGLEAPTHPDVEISKVLYAEALVQLKRYGDGLVHLREVEAVRRSRKNGEHSPETLIVQFKIASALQEQGGENWKKR